MSERQGVEIDYCPQCRGVWLDRGELDKILDRAKLESEPAAAPAPHRSEPQHSEPQRPLPHPYKQQSHDSHESRPQQYQKRKKSPFEFLGDLFEG